MSSGSENSYKSILKGTSILGGTQIFQILISLIRGKFVAILLGPEGMGVNALLTSSTTTLQQFSSVGLGLSIVREVSANSEENPHRCALVLTICRKLLFITGIIGALICALFSSQISKWTFGTSDNYYWFIILSLFIFLTTMGNGEMSFLQGFHQVKRLAKSSTIGSIAGLVVGVPLYWLFGIEGIPYAMVSFALTVFISYRFFLRKVIFERVPDCGKIKYNTSLRSNKFLVKRLLVLGATLMVASLIGSLVVYLINVFIRETGSEFQVGLYQAANSITLQYAGVVFSAMALDYFPRLTAVKDDSEQTNLIVNRQTEIISLIISPLSIVLIICAPLVVKILLAEDFSECVPLLQCLALAVYFRAVCYPMGYISFARGDKRTFFLFEGIVGNLLNLFITCYFYKVFGLIGLGYAQIAVYFISTIAYYILTRRLYGYRPTLKVVVLNLALALPAIAAYILSLSIKFFSPLIITLPLCVITVSFSLISLAKAFRR